MNRFFKNSSLLFAAILLASGSATAQQSVDTARSKQDPLELPQIIITGQEVLNVPGGTKQDPYKTRTLQKAELDSLNSLEKQTTLITSPVLMPSTALSVNPFNGFIRGEFGQFITPDVSAGYRTEAAGFNLFSNGRFTTSGGHVDNADFTKMSGELNASYTAPEKYFIFGGSTTETSLLFARQSYKLYALESAPQRSTNNLNARIDVDGNFEGFAFSTGTGFDMTGLTHEARETTNNNINGFLKLQNQWRGFLVGGDVLLDLHTLRGEGMRFIEAAGTIQLSGDLLTVRGRGGFQTAKGNFDARNALLVDAETEFRLSELFTIRGGASTGLRNNSFKTLLGVNPYLADSAQIDYTHEIIGARGFLIIHPTPEMSFSAGARTSSLKRFGFFRSADSGIFAPQYEDATLVEFLGEAFWRVTPSDNFTANVILTGTSLAEFAGKVIPYIAPLQAALTYNRSWTEEFSTSVTAAFVGNRYADLQNTRELNAYTDLRFEANYSLNERFTIFARANNLLNQDIFVWENYRERGIFGAAGVLWRF